MTKCRLHHCTLFSAAIPLRFPGIASLRILLAALAIAAAVVFSPRTEAASVVINEFMAENDGSLSDVDGDSPDWIELFNTSAATVNLGGWHLTDSPTNLTKWMFPATNLLSGRFLIVFASGKDRTNAAQLHTNFQLQNGGGYLALVQPDSVTIASEFNYPQQHRNVSYGPGSSNPPPTILLGANAAAQWLVPVDGALGASWIAPTFNASAWSNAATPLRYDVAAGGSSGPPLLSVDFNSRSANNATNTQGGFSAFVIGGTFGATQTGSVTNGP